MLDTFLGQRSWQCIFLLVGVNILGHLRADSEKQYKKKQIDCKEDETGSLTAKEKTTAKEMEQLHT